MRSIKCKRIFVCLLVGIIVISCKKNEIGRINKIITIQVLNNKDYIPYSNGKIEVAQFEKSKFGKYWWKVRPLYEIKLDDSGMAEIKIDSTGIYYIHIYKKNEKFSHCTNELYANEIDLDSVYIIKCLDNAGKLDLITN